MPTRITARSPAIGAALVAGALAFGAGAPADAARGCRANPARQAEPGSHWYYRIDRTTQQKCWYMIRSDGLESADETSEPAAADGRPQLLSWLSSAISSITRPAPSVAEQDMRDPQATEPARRRKAQVVRRPERPDPPRAPSKSASRSAAQPAAATPTAASPLDEPATNELYQDFLRWRARQLLTASPPKE